MHRNIAIALIVLSAGSAFAAEPKGTKQAPAQTKQGSTEQQKVAPPKAEQPAAGQATAQQPNSVTPQTEEQKAFYALGLLLARTVSVFNLSPAELEMVERGLHDAIVAKSPLFDPTSYNDELQALAQARRKAQGEKQAAAGREYLEQAAKEKGAVKTESGMVYIPLQEGSGPSPAASDTVKVHYRGTLPDGKEFDSSYKRGQHAEFRLDGVIKCWTEGVQKMKVGGKAKLVCPPSLAYGETGAGELILPGATLVFEVELLEVKSQVSPPASSTPAAPKK